MALNGNLPLLSSSKNRSHCACHTHQALPTPSAWNHEHDRVSDFIPIASLLEWQWHRIVMRNSNFTTLLETELVGPPNAEKSHTHSQSHFTQCYKRGWVSPPPTPSVSPKGSYALILSASKLMWQPFLILNYSLF